MSKYIFSGSLLCTVIDPIKKDALFFLFFGTGYFIFIHSLLLHSDFSARCHHPCQSIRRNESKSGYICVKGGTAAQKHWNKKKSIFCAICAMSFMVLLKMSEFNNRHVIFCFGARKSNLFSELVQRTFSVFKIAGYSCILSFSRNRERKSIPEIKRKWVKMASNWKRDRNCGSKIEIKKPRWKIWKRGKEGGTWPGSGLMQRLLNWGRLDQMYRDVRVRNFLILQKEK